MKLDAPIGGILTGRLLLVSYLPTYAGAVFVLVVVWAGTPVDFGRAWRTAAALSVGEVLVLGLAIMLGAVVLHPFQLRLVRLLEGAWPRWVLVGDLSRRMQRFRRERLAGRAEVSEDPDMPVSDRQLQEAGAAGSRLRRRFPPGDQVRPTALGNVLAAMEHRAGTPYGWDAVVAWPRLYPVLGDRVRTIVDGHRDSLDVMARLAVTFALVAVVSAVLLVRSGWWLLLPLGAAVVARVAYRAAVQSALAYGEAVESAFDLHRFDLFTALHLPLPADREQEREVAARLCAFWRQGDPVELTYEHGKPA
ncbi:hypothetical protein AB0J35_62405 [Nonomuraea angiospora]|uniref:hypothetical protein n=1 Tax=Nonomuraea angiospora TaxID=46172 RepID=UPI003422B1DA